MDLGKYAAYIVPAYAVSVLVLGGLAIDSLMRARKWKREAERREAAKK